MADALSRWRGKLVNVFYANPAVPPVQGKLNDVDGSGIVIDLAEGRTFIPYVAIRQLVGPTD